MPRTVSFPVTSPGTPAPSKTIDTLSMNTFPLGDM
jgi:hypothetical protein